MKLLIRSHNRELLQNIAAMMSDSSLTSALNFVLETQGLTALEQLEAMRIQGSSRTAQGNSGAGFQRAIAVPQSFTPKRQMHIPELNSDDVDSAFD